MKTIETLKSTDHIVISKLIDISNGNTSPVDYATTIFNTKDDYMKVMNTIGNNVIGSQIRNFVNTPLVAERGNQNKTYFSQPDKGIAFGYIFIDYIEKNPLLVITCDKSGNKYEYKSCTYDKKEKVWKNGTTKSSTISDVKGLTEMIIENLSKDVLSFS